MLKDIYSKRQASLKMGNKNLYKYDSIPDELRVQIGYVLDDILGNKTLFEAINLGNDGRITPDSLCGKLKTYLCREYGVRYLAETPRRNFDNALILNITEIHEFIKIESTVEKILDFIELFFRTLKEHGGFLIDKFCDTNDNKIELIKKLNKILDEAIKELNVRFLEHGIGYQYESGKIIRIDSKYTYEEMVKPALGLLHRNGYKGAEAEFLKAHEYFRKGYNASVLNECLKAFESTLKTICDKRSWEYDKSTSKNLIEICFKNNLIHNFLQDEYNSLINLLKSGVPMLRNKLSAHGQGSEELPPIPDYYAAYMIHMTASNIIFLIEAENKLE
jgi:hypothetical protein